MMNNQSKHDLWKKYIEDYRTSGLKAQQWCDQNDLPLTRLRYWIYKFNKEAASPNNLLPEIVPVKSPDTITNLHSYSNFAISIKFGNISIDISDECSTNTIRSILETLSSYA